MGGRLAHLGVRLIDFAAKKLADQFFENSPSLLENPGLKGGAVIQTMNDAFTKSELTRLSTGPVRFSSFQRVKAGNLLV